jgi:hypothetical protein
VAKIFPMYTTGSAIRSTCSGDRTGMPTPTRSCCRPRRDLAAWNSTACPSCALRGAICENAGEYPASVLIGFGSPKDQRHCGECFSP